MTLRILPLAFVLLGTPASAERTHLLVLDKSAETAKLLKEPIDFDLDGTVNDALKAIAKKTDWTLIVSAPTLDQRLSLRTAKRPLGEALDLVLEAGRLQGWLRPGGKLVVHSASDAEEEDADSNDEEPTLAPVPQRPGKNDRAAFGQDLLIKKGEIVDDVVVNGGDLIVEGRVTGDAVAMGGDIVVQKGGVIEGDASAMGGNVVIENGGIIKGSTQKFGHAFGGMLKGLAKRSGKGGEAHVEQRDDEGGMGWVVAKLLLAVLAFILNIMLIAFVPERIERIISTLDHRPLQAGGAGFAMLLGFLPFCLMLIVTIVGIFILPLALFAYVFVYVVGYAALSVAIGRRLPVLQGRKTLLSATALGLLALTVVGLIPYIGTLLVFLAASFSAGATVISRLGSGPKVIDESLTAL